MRLFFKGYEVEIRAKSTIGSKRFNEKDTMALLNTVSVDLFELADYMEVDDREVCRKCAKNRRKESNELYEALNNRGYYDN